MDWARSIDQASVMPEKLKTTGLHAKALKALGLDPAEARWNGDIPSKIPKIPCQRDSLSAARCCR